ncbi:lipid A deacylase LpxR family protein [Flavobacterium sp. W22_SRS_FP1]|uniref:lipid A deacylase LpxR family protein n=1 Tax=Flavobacterium sp. W22_SRS_FP1 TaxID=3240276 RepID=UPI003F8EAD49
MLCKKALLVLAVMMSFLAFGQQKNTEIGIITDNDLYTSSRNDKYYTNGLEVFYRFLSKNKKEEVNKEITQISIGQYIYTPRFLNSPRKEIMDRPFAGYLFGEIGKNIFYKNESVFKIDLQIGVVGPNSFAKETQKNFHDLMGYKVVRGWEYQVKSAVAVQTHFLFSKKIFSKRDNKAVDLHFQSEANLGTIFTGGSAGFMTRIGFSKLAPMYDSNFYGGSIGSKAKEFYFYIAPSMNYQLYDATIQGSLFNNNSPVTFDLVPLRFNGEAGLKYRKNNLNLS